MPAAGDKDLGAGEVAMLDREQIDWMIEISTTDKARRADTKARYGHEPGLFGAWLNADVDRAEDRVAWLTALKAWL